MFHTGPDYESYRLVAERLAVRPKLDGGWVDARCPECGAFREGKTKFHFDAHFGRCFVCGYKGGIAFIARRLGAEPEGPPRSPPLAKPPRPPAVWQQNPEAWVAEFCRPADRIPLWQAYKPVTVEQIARYQLGVGALPLGTSRCRHRRLVIPIRQGGAVTGFRARRIEGECRLETCDPEGQVLVDNWVAPLGSKKALFNADALAAHARALRAGGRRKGYLWVAIAENPVDALLVEDWLACSQGVMAIGLALLSASNWDPAWGPLIRAADPNLVLVWLDNDLPGQAIGATKARLLADYRRLHDGKEPAVVGAGMRIATELQNLGVPTRLIRWPDVPEVPAKADPAWALAHFARPGAQVES